MAQLRHPRAVPVIDPKATSVQFTFDDRTVTVNIPRLDQLEQAVRTHFRARTGFALATVNLDHLAKMARSPDFVRTYAAQDLIVADGRPIVALSQLAGRPVDLLPGSDLVEPLCRWAAAEGVRLALVGSWQGALDDAERVLCARVPGLQVVLKHPPSQGFDPQGEEARDILAALQDQGIGLCFLALGAPKQEELALRGRDLAPGVGFASIGAGLDFLGGHQVRAPKWMRRIGMEWLWRMLQSPRRLVPRYARCFAILPGQIWKAWRLGRV